MTPLPSKSPGAGAVHAGNLGISQQHLPDDELNPRGLLVGEDLRGAPVRYVACHGLPGHGTPENRSLNRCRGGESTQQTHVDRIAIEIRCTVDRGVASVDTIADLTDHFARTGQLYSPRIERRHLVVQQVYGSSTSSLATVVGSSTTGVSHWDHADSARPAQGP